SVDGQVQAWILWPVIVRAPGRRMPPGKPIARRWPIPRGVMGGSVHGVEVVGGGRPAAPLAWTAGVEGTIDDVAGAFACPCPGASGPCDASIPGFSRAMTLRAVRRCLSVG